ncbi:MAG TPA: FtsX-like permease family protein [Anaeromyxobacteraceae bacterium]|nr:FtsX-like permease family protein [Anaeromyxobacteraceae bacterium]
MRLRADTAIMLRIAVRNLFAGRAKTLIIGGIILIGAALVVVGSSLVDSVDRGMRASIQGSLGGHLQVYDERSKDPLALYGGMMGESVLEPIEDFAKVKSVLEQVPNVKQVVPMGIDQAMVATGNQLDVALEKLRQDVRERLGGDHSPELGRRYEAHKAHLRRMIGILREDLAQARVLADPNGPDIKEMIRNADALKRASEGAFWEDFDRAPLDGLEFLENRVAPLAMEAGFTFVRYVGTDLEAFFRAFDRTQVVEGERVPPGHRGILLGKWYAEEWLKLKPARLLDKIKTARDAQGRRIARDEELSRWVREASGQLREVSLQLDPIQAEEAATRLRRALGSEERELPKLLAALFQVNDDNFDRNYRIFYDELAPLLRLYMIRIGDTITIKAPAKSGYMNSVNVKVYGFVQFRGLEQSGLAGVMSLMDLMTFRDLYGYVTREKAAEIARIQQRSGARAVSRENAEAELFGEASGLVGQGTAAAIDDSKLLVPRTEAELQDQQDRSYSQEEIDSGVALNAALILQDPGKLRDTARDVEAATRAAGLHLKVVDWQEASGLVGRFVTLARLILWVAVLIIFLVALVIINNAMVMATLQRVKEIGTMRAIGAQRRFVLAMLLVETVAVGIVFGLVGAVVGVGGLWAIRAAGGIPATNDQLYFFFSGPALLPTLGSTSVAIALAIVIVVSVLSGLYPALLAMRVTPLEAMQAEE